MSFHLPAGPASWMVRARAGSNLGRAGDGEENEVIERLSEMPEGVDGFRLVGEISKADYDEVLIPWVNGIAAAEADVRAVIVVGEDFDGYEARAAWEDTKLGVEMEARHRELWKRIAIVTEVGWIRQLARVFGWLVPGELRVFDLDQMDEAEEWAAG